jgi:uncharacterized membrane protein YfcA
MLPLWVFLVSAFAAFLSSMSGGGSSVIALPIFLSLGISFPLATVINKVAGIFWLLPSSYNYLKGRTIDWRFLLSFALAGLVGVYLGVLIVLRINQRLLKTGVGIFITALVIYIAFKKDAGIKTVAVCSRQREPLAYGIALPMGVYEGVLGSGNGIAFSAISFYAKGFDFTSALGYYFSISFIWSVFGSLILIYRGYFSLALVVPAILGSVPGAYLGSKYARYKGNRFIKIVFVVIGGILGVKLTLGL